jgi:cysteinyl-tRNA synthetase
MTTIYDTASNAKVQLSPGGEGKFRMYVCGPTVYDDPHLGHGRMAVVFDLLRRRLEAQGVEVVMVQNITDVDDKIIDRAKRENRSVPEVAQDYERSWFEATEALGVKLPTHSPRASDWIGEMVGLIEQMINAGAAYRTADGVYLSVERVPGYPVLSRQQLDDLKAGARVEVDEDKLSPADFALWKLVDGNEFGYESPFGWGRPGWHTECVAMSLGLLGEAFELHGGGMDLIFPHHDNELAQAKVLGRRFAKTWMHNGFVVMEGEKMSKSLGNVLSLSEAIHRFGGSAVRFAYLRAHYRSPIEMSPDAIEEASRALERISDFLDLAKPGYGADEEALARFRASLDDDLDTPKALAVLFDEVRSGNLSLANGSREEASRAALTVGLMLKELGINLEERELPHEVVKMVADRERAKGMRDFATADRIRSEVENMGYQIKDTKEGPKVTRVRK